MMSDVKHLDHEIISTVPGYRVVQITDQSNVGKSFGNSNGGHEFVIPDCGSKLASYGHPGNARIDSLGDFVFYVRGADELRDARPVVMSDGEYYIFSRLCYKYNKYYSVPLPVLTEAEWGALSKFAGFEVAAVIKNSSGYVYCCAGIPVYWMDGTGWHDGGEVFAVPGLRDKYTNIDSGKSLTVNPYFKGEGNVE